MLTNLAPQLQVAAGHPAEISFSTFIQPEPQQESPHLSSPAFFSPLPLLTEVPSSTLPSRPSITLHFSHPQFLHPSLSSPLQSLCPCSAGTPDQWFRSSCRSILTVLLTSRPSLFPPPCSQVLGIFLAAHLCCLTPVLQKLAAFLTSRTEGLGLCWIKVVVGFL